MMIDPDEPPEAQIARQARIIDALVARADREADARPSRFAPFRSAIELQGQVWARTRDLERAASELASLRLDHDRAQANLAEAVSALDGGFALFADGRLELCNELFRMLLPDVAAAIRPGLELSSYLGLIGRSREVVSGQDDAGRALLARAVHEAGATAPLSVVVELTGDRFFQVGLQHTSPRNAVLLQTDISAIVRQNRSEREALIDRQAHYLDAAVEHLDSGLCTFDREGHVVVWNERFRTLMSLPLTGLGKGTSLAWIMGTLRARGLILEPGVLEAEGWYRELARRGRVRRRLHHASGRVLDLHAHPLPDGGFIVDLADVTPEVRQTQILEARVADRTAELTRANRRLRAQSRAQGRVEEELRRARDVAQAAVSSKTRFLAAASHDLLQPISAAKLLISSLQGKAAGTGMAQGIEHLAQSFTSIEHLLQALLDISRLDSVERALEPAEVDLGALVGAVVRDQMPLAGGRGVRLGMVGCACTVRSDARYLGRSVQNLVVNAIQYTPPGGRVLVGCRRTGQGVRLEVHDTGPGIAAAEQARIFEEFARGAGEGVPGGMGLGLSIVERTCRNLGHDLSLRSVPGRGSCFAIGMEVAAGDRATPPAIAAPEPEPEPETDEAAGLIVLLVENDAALQFATVELLEGWGAGILVAADVAGARARVAEIGGPPDIVLADYHLDDGPTGLVAIDAVRAAAGGCVPAILLTGNRGAALEAGAARRGVPVLTKPVDIARLRAEIARHATAPAVPDDESRNRHCAPPG